MKKILLVLILSLCFVKNVYAETPEEILQKVADNYTAINDMKADITDITTTKITGQPDQIKGPNNRIYYQKSPNKIKVENPQDNSYYIIKGSTIYLKEAGREVVEIPGDTTFTNHIDYIYNLPEFIQSNTLTIDTTYEKDGDTIYEIKAEPLSSPKPFSKMLMTTNYTKGTIINIEFYNLSDEIVLGNETLDYLEVEGIMLPLKTRETKYYDDATVITEVTYANILLNKGIDDTVFQP